MYVGQEYFHHFPWRSTGAKCGFTFSRPTAQNFAEKRERGNRRQQQDDPPKTVTYFAALEHIQIVLLFLSAPKVAIYNVALNAEKTMSKCPKKI